MRTRVRSCGAGTPQVEPYALAQALVLRGSSDFESVEQYAKFVRSIVDRRKRLLS